jgi:hypothetical protein
MPEIYTLPAFIKRQIQDYVIGSKLLKYHNYWLLLSMRPYWRHLLSLGPFVATQEGYIGPHPDAIKLFVQQGRNAYLHKKVFDSFSKLTSETILDLLHKTPNYDTIIAKICKDGTTLSIAEELEIKNNLNLMVGDGEEIIQSIQNIFTGVTSFEELRGGSPHISEQSIHNAKTAYKYITSLASANPIDIPINFPSNVTNFNKMKEILSDSNNGLTRIIESIQATGKCANIKCKNKIKSLCANCRIVGYCSKVCQKTHWKLHKKKCSALYKTKNTRNTYNCASRIEILIINAAFVNLEKLHKPTSKFVRLLYNKRVCIHIASMLGCV